jgi:hypothetical protein
MKRVFAFLAPVLTIAVLSTPSNVDAFIDTVIVTPASPTTEDDVSIEVSGYFPDACWLIEDESMDMHGTAIDIVIRARDSWQQPGDPCSLQPQEVLYVYDYLAGILAEGTYTVTVIEDHHSPRETPDTSIIQFRVDTPTASDPGDIGSIPHRFTLQQNHPNPFNTATTIVFSLDKTGYVSLVVYDLLGRKVRTIVDEDLSSGGHTATWDGKDDYGTDVTTGVYFYRLTTGNQISSRKMVLLK